MKLIVKVVKKVLKLLTKIIPMDAAKIVKLSDRTDLAVTGCTKPAVIPKKRTVYMRYRIPKLQSFLNYTGVGFTYGTATQGNLLVMASGTCTALAVRKTMAYRIPKLQEFLGCVLMKLFPETTELIAVQKGWLSVIPKTCTALVSVAHKVTALAVIPETCTAVAEYRTVSYIQYMRYRIPELRWTFMGIGNFMPEVTSIALPMKDVVIIQEVKVMVKTYYAYNCGCKVLISSESDEYSKGLYMDGKNEMFFDSDYCPDRYVYMFALDAIVEETEKIEHIDKPCLECALKSMYDAMYDSPSNGAAMSHGLLAYNKDKKPESDDEAIEIAMQRLDAIHNHPEWDICCTDNNCHIGPIGVFGFGIISLSFTKDVYSYIDNNNVRRLPGEMHMAYVQGHLDDTGTYDNNGESILLRCDSQEQASGYYHEHWVSDMDIVGIWVNTRSYNKMNNNTKQMIQDYCRKHGYAFTKVYY